MEETKSVQEQLKEFEQQESDNWQRLTFALRKHLDFWAHNHYKPIWNEVKLSYMPVMFSIMLEGSTASEIARDSMLPKQTISRTIKELEDKELVISETSGTDKRTEVISLTKKGKEFILDAKQETHKMNVIYKKLVGSKDFAIATKVLNMIVKYHESIAHNNATPDGK